MRRWLQQHVFKVGWLLTKNMRTTTILFYTLFLPGVILYEFTYWMMAGILNIRAERALSWPDAQQVAELRLNFIKLGRNVGSFRLALINLAPFLVGTLVIWWAAFNVLQIDEAWAILQAEGLRGVGDSLTRLFSTPDVFLWVYILFSVGNTMMPRWSELKGARVLLVIAGIVFGALLILGVADDFINNGLLIPFNNALNYISTVFVTVILVNSIMTAILGTVEALIERVTGDSATFERGKLVAITRADRLEQERIAAEKARKAAQTARERKPAAVSGPPSIYRLPLPTPPALGREETISVRRDDERVLGAGVTTPSPAKPALPGLSAAAPPPASPPTLTGLARAPSQSSAASPSRPSLSPSGSADRPASASFFKPPTPAPEANKDEDDLDDESEEMDDEEIDESEDESDDDGADQVDGDEEADDEEDDGEDEDDDEGDTEEDEDDSP